MRLSYPYPQEILTDEQLKEFERMKSVIDTSTEGIYPSVSGEMGSAKLIVKNEIEIGADHE